MMNRSKTFWSWTSWWGIERDEAHNASIGKVTEQYSEVVFPRSLSSGSWASVYFTHALKLGVMYG